MEDARRAESLKRLRYIEGHVAGIRRMVEQDAYCVDVLKQTYAVRKALEKLETLLLARHLQSCVPSGIREGREEQVIGELLEIYGVIGPRGAIEGEPDVHED